MSWLRLVFSSASYCALNAGVRCHSQTRVSCYTAAPPDAAAGTLLAGLRGRRDALAAADLVTKALSAITEAAWATAQPLQPGSFAAALCAYAIELVGSLRCGSFH